MDELELLLLRLAQVKNRAQQQSETQTSSDEATVSTAVKLALPREQPPDAQGKLMLLCNMCLEPFERLPRSEDELEYVRRTLLICCNTYRPAVCDNCLGLHAHWQTPPQKFHDSPNFMLRHQVRFPNGEPR